MTQSWMLYGANGFTGELIAAEAKARGERPILAGRREEAVRPLADRLGLPWRVFPLDAGTAAHLEGVAAVVHAAGPFSATSRPMVDACLAARAHYLDITGEIEVFEACHARDAEARQRGIVIMPGVGFDVVPSDCLAKRLSEELPGADRLDLAIAFGGAPSRGTARTSVEGLAGGGAVREGGTIRREPIARRSMRVRFRDKERLVMSIPWGDVSTAFHSTSIPSITTYAATTAAAVTALRLGRPALKLLSVPLVKRAVDRWLDRRGSAAARTDRPSQLWGRATHPSGSSVSATLTTPDGYQLTARTAVEIVRRVVAGKVTPGAWTPSVAFGSRFITEIEGCDLRLD
jgi:saccharopine dehydrogenase (NAD+, L-lysine-forming)